MDGVMHYHPDVDYFPITATSVVFYSYYTKAICQQFKILIYELMTHHDV